MRRFCLPESLGSQLLTGSPCSAGHRQKLEDQTKAFPDRFGDLERVRMRVTPSMPSPRGSLSTTSHFNSQAQTPIQGTAQGGCGGGGVEARDVVLVLQARSSSGVSHCVACVTQEAAVLICSCRCFLRAALDRALHSFTQQTFTDTHHVPGRRLGPGVSVSRHSPCSPGARCPLGKWALIS